MTMQEDKGSVAFFSPYLRDGTEAGVFTEEQKGTKGLLVLVLPLCKVSSSTKGIETFLWQNTGKGKQVASAFWQAMCCVFLEEEIFLGGPKGEQH